MVLLFLLIQDIEPLIERLGDADPVVREEASRSIRKIGRRALEPLRKAAESARDPEVVVRARELIDEIDWPEPGPAVKGLRLAIKPRPRYAVGGPIVIRARLLNAGEADVELGAVLLEWGGGEKLTHPACMGRDPAEPFPELPKSLKKGETIEFVFSPRAWCFANEHSKSRPVQVLAGEHELRLGVTAVGAEASSNSVRIRVEP
jgi:hypothetical protein